MKKIIIKVIILSCPLWLFGQENKEMKRNSIYIEAFGQGLYNSISFDRLYHTDKKIKTSFNCGLTIIPSSELFVLATPIAYNFLFGQKNHHLELGLGFTAMYIRRGKITVGRGLTENGVTYQEEFIGHENAYFTYFTPKLGYRFQKPAGGFFFRFTFTPPIAGINRYGGTKGGIYDDKMDNSYTEYFKSAAFFEGFKIIPWGGISFGWTLKK